MKNIKIQHQIHKNIKIQLQINEKFSNSQSNSQKTSKIHQQVHGKHQNSPTSSQKTSKYTIKFINSNKLERKYGQNFYFPCSRCVCAVLKLLWPLFLSCRGKLECLSLPVTSTLSSICRRGQCLLSNQGILKGEVSLYC
jgi:hypothetical protein